MTIRLRAHHLLCLLTYAGRGYGPAFVANMDRVAERVRRGEVVRIVAGPDEVCAPLLADRAAHCRGRSVLGRDRAAALAVGALLGRPVQPGCLVRLDGEVLDRLRQAFAGGGVRRRACAGCEWAGFCTALARQGFAGTRLGSPAGQGVSGSKVRATPFMQ